MRTLKKSLALVLALVMVLGLGVIGASADFTDVTDETDYNQEITILTGMGVIDGVTEDTFNPGGTLTREQAAKIVAFIKLGPDRAKLISEAASAPFEDVAANRWSAGYIEYNANLKIVEGVSETEFNPSGKLTTAAFTKMLLVAVGFDPDENGLNGASWAINTATLAAEAGIYDSDIGVSNKTEITRAQACRLAWLALNYSITGETSEYVVYESNKEDADELYRGSDPITALLMQQANEGSVLKLVKTSKGSLGDTVFTLKEDITTDAFGRESVEYNNGKTGNAKVVYASFAETPVVSYVAPVSPSKIYNDLGLSKSVAATWIIDGWTDSKGDGTKLTIDKSDTSKFVGGYGVLTEVYYDGSNVRVIQIATYLGKVVDVTKAKAATATTDAVDASVTVELYGTDYEGAPQYVYETDAFAKNDYVLVTAKNHHDGDKMTIQSMEKATVVTGTISRYVADTSATVNGTTYSKAAKGSMTVGEAPFTTQQAFYVDEHNNLYLIGKADTATQNVDGYFYVTAYQASLTGGAGNLFEDEVATSAAAKAQVVTTSGAVQVIDLDVYSKTSGGTTKYYFNTVDGSEKEITAELVKAGMVTTGDEVGNWTGYTVEDGKYTLVGLDRTGAYQIDKLSAAYDGATTTLDNKYLTSATTFTYINTKDEKVSTVTGYKNIKIAKDAKLLVVYGNAAGTVVSAIYQVNTTSDTSATATYAYAAAKGGLVADGTEYTFYINGEVVTYPVKSGVTVTEKKVYTLTIDKGVVTAAAEKLDCTGAGVEVTLVDDAYFVASTPYTYASSGCQVFNVTTGTPGTADTIEVGDKVCILTDTSGAAILVYIVG